MKRSLVLLTLLSLSVAALAAEPPAMSKGVDSVPPPPELGSPGVKAATVDTDSNADSARPATDANGDEAPSVKVRQEGDDTVEEYRQGGQLTMVRISRKGGIPQTFIDTDGDGRLESNPREGPVAPVYYTLYRWN